MRTLTEMEIKSKTDSSDNTIKYKESLPLADIIEKFQKIKESRFKPKDKSKLFTQKTDTAGNGTHFKKSTHDILLEITTPEPERFFSGNDNTDAPQQSTFRRRMSLPSLFHPFSPIPLFETNNKEIVKDEREIEKEVEAESLHTGRRHSVAHVLKEYAKTDLQELSRLEKLGILKGALKPIKDDDAGELEEAEENIRRYLTGEELHAFYSFWDRPDKAKLDEKIRAHRRLSPISSNKDDTGRPRVFSL